ncbi:amidohydrolase, partial [bacterium LRH843]|nr:amidohydrolase [bacterium LRH843]
SFALTALLSSTVVMMSGCTTSPSGTASNTQQQAQNALLVYGRHILTMQGMQPSYVDAMIIQDGKIRYTGPLSEAEKLAPQAKRLNLNNNTVIPGIIDAHSHLNSVGM